MDNSSANIDLIRSHVDIIILKPLLSRDCYGYEILKEIETNSKGLFSLKQPTMYSCLKRLEKQGYINSYLGSESNGAQRRYYSLTTQGRDFLESQQNEWEFVRTVLGGLVSDTDFDEEKDVPPFDPSKYRPLTKRTRNDDNDENVKVVKEVVYVPVEQEKKELTTDEVKEMLTDDDINSIVKDYLDKHPEVLSNGDDDNNNNDNESIIETNCDDSTLEDSNSQNYFTDYNDISNNDVVEEDVALNSDYDDLEENYQTTPSNDTTINELLNQQNNDIESEDNTENIDNTYTSNAIENEPIEDAQEEESSHFASYTEDDTDESYNDADDEYKYMTFEPTTPLKLNDNPKTEDNQLFDYSKNMEEKQEEKIDTNKVLTALDIIYTNNDEADEPKEEEIISDQYIKLDYDTNATNTSGVMTINDMKAMYANQNIKIRPYARTSAILFYENNYYYSNKVARDTSFIMFVLFFIESLITHFTLAQYYPMNVGYLVLTWVVAAIIPAIFFVKWTFAPNSIKPTKVSLRLSLMLSLIVMLNIALVIFLVGFFGFGADYSDINTMVLPIITPLVFLINIPLASIVYYLLYRSKRYNLR